MKTITKSIFIAILAVTFIVAGAGRSLAHYDHDDKGWFDEHHHHHDFIMHNGHRGYWDHDDKGAKIFINL